MNGKYFYRYLGLVIMICGLLFVTAIKQPPAAATHLTPTNADAAATGYFIPVADEAEFYTYGTPVEAIMGPQNIRLTLNDTTLDVQFVGANPATRPLAGGQSAATAHYYCGQDPQQWETNVPLYTEVLYPNLYPHIDLHYTLQADYLKSTFIIAPGAKPQDIQIAYNGAETVAITENGAALIITLPGGETWREVIPAAYQDINGEIVDVKITFQQTAHNTVTYVPETPLNPGYALWIDPLVYSTYLGGIRNDVGWSVAVGKDGSTYISGYSESPHIPLNGTTAPGPGGNVFVAKYDPAGALKYLSLFGGEGGEEGNGVGVDDAGNAYVAGQTFSTDFPILNAWQPHFAGYEEAFLLKVDPQGQLVYSTYIGGLRGEEVNDIHVTPEGNVYLGGEVYSDDYPLMHPWSSATYGAGEEDGFITAFDRHGMMVYSTYISASERDQVFRIAVDAEGYVYGAGQTSSPDFPIINGFQSTYGGEWDDCLVFKLAPWSNEMVYTTFLGGNNRDECWGIAVDETGAAYVTGYTLSGNFPVTADALQPRFNGQQDAFVAKISPDGRELLYSTFLGGNDRDWAWGLALDSENNIYVTGETSSTNFVQKEALQSGYGGKLDAFLTVLDSKGALKYSSYFGGSQADRSWRMVVDPNWIVHLVGSTTSTDFPLRSPAANTNSGLTDAFVARFGLFPTPTPTPTPTPSPTPTPTPTPTPYAAAQIGPAGGAVWLAYPEHLTLLTVPENSLDQQGTFTLTYAEQAQRQESLYGIHHFFTLTAAVPGSTLWQPPRFVNPLRLYLNYENGVIREDTLQLYRMTSSGWTTSAITMHQHLPGYLVADVHYTGLYGLMGWPYTLYLPVTLRGMAR